MTTPRKTAGYGWRKQHADLRDYQWVDTREGQKMMAVTRPRKVDLRETGYLSPIKDQLQLGSCTANAWANQYEFLARKLSLNADARSRLFIYYNERVIEGSASWDSGAELRDGAKTLANDGAALESEWAYSDDDVTFRERPPQSVYDSAAKHKALQYSQLHYGHLRACLAGGYPFVFGFTVYESFESSEVANTGLVPNPTPDERVLGGHAVIALGYDWSKTRAPYGLVLCANSWGEGWGEKGCFWLPEQFFTTPESSSLASDFWTLRLVS